MADRGMVFIAECNGTNLPTADTKTNWPVIDHTKSIYIKYLNNALKMQHLLTT